MDAVPPFRDITLLAIPAIASPLSHEHSSCPEYDRISNKLFRPAPPARLTFSCRVRLCDPDCLVDVIQQFLSPFACRVLLGIEMRQRMRVGAVAEVDEIREDCVFYAVCSDNLTEACKVMVLAELFACLTVELVEVDRRRGCYARASYRRLRNPDQMCDGRSGSHLESVNLS
ncbi:uncharacterized protein FSUBG_13617 [Fusarium subglutinans]|uniref:Uncharacterized protein n=1 Tax=Gibberella subglutinans TaxID=42677 RepID=A0A8H5NXN7_GIBSU|nr:uncharacterized protein FSUBG_13617 [Fusarium subglutinans]KAF5579430.1 hypothetical protein FSUBG_13617 [Fusarium subglutinans]